jgi:hypothetical protein
MTVLNRSMFRRPSALPPLRGPMPVVRETYPVVQRQAGTPPSGEVQEYIDKGYDTYEYTADQAQDKGGILQWLKKQGNKISDFMDKPTDQWGEGTDYVLDEYEFNLLYPRVDINSTTIEERTINTNSDDYRRLVEITTRAEGSPPTGEISDRFGQKRINELMQKTSSDTGPLSKQWDRDEGVSQFTMEDFIKLEAPNWHAEGVLKLVQAFGTQDEIETMIDITKRLGEEDRDEQQYEEDYKIRRALFEKYVDRIGGMDNYFKTHDRLNREWELRDERGTLYPELHRQLGSPPTGEQGTFMDQQIPSLYYGDQGEQELHRELVKVANGQITDPQEIEAIITASLGEFGEGHVMAIIKEGGALMSPAQGYFTEMPDGGSYWNQTYPSEKPLSRQMGSPPMGEQVVAENVGIMDGFNQGEEQVMDTVMTEGEGARNAIDQSDTYDELMRAIRGDDLSEADRRQELASYVGEKDAEETPDSVLALVQPVMQMLDQQTANTGIAQTEEAMMMPNVMPQQQQPVGVAHGGPIQRFNQGDSVLATKKAEYLPAYMDIVDKYLDPNQGQADALLSLSKAGFNYALGATPTEAGALFFDEVGQKGQARAASEDALKMKTEFAALNAAQASLLADAKASKEQSKQKQNYTVGLNDETDKLIAAILGITKTERTRVGPDTDEEIVIDYDRLYKMYPKGSTLQWNWDFSQFLGKKGSTVSYEGVEKNKDGGIVHRDEGTPEQGENSEETLEELYQKHGFIFDPPLITGAGERDKISKILYGTDAALKELMEMKQHLVDDPTLGGLPGLFLEKTRGLFTMFDQLDNAYLNDKYIKEGSGIFKFFDRPAITEIYKSKKRISKALADLASLKGARQPTVAQTEETKVEVDPTGGFGATVSMEKIDAVGDEFVVLIKELLRGLGGPNVTYKAGPDMEPIVEGALAKDSIVRATVDQEYLTTQFDKLDAYINQLKTLVPTEGSRSEVEAQAEELQNIKSLTIEEYEDLFGKILSEAKGE